MSDQEKPAFHVVDRRRAAQENPAEDTSPAAESIAPESDHSETTSPPSVEESPPESDSDTSETEDADAGDFGQLPDPAFLLHMGAMQMETRALLQALLTILDGHARRAMGFLADPRTGETSKDLPSAQLAIDTVQFLYGKVESSLPDLERREMQRRLSDLRMNYLAKLREA